MVINGSYVQHLFAPLGSQVKDETLVHPGDDDGNLWPCHDIFKALLKYVLLVVFRGITWYYPMVMADIAMV